MVTYFLARYQRGEKIHEELLKNPFLTGEEHILVGMPRMRISFSLRLFWKKARNGTQTSRHHKMAQGEDTSKSKLKGVTIMSEKCKFLDSCGFFLNFRGNSEVVERGWIRLFCTSQERSENCERKKIRKQTGQPPPDNMTPTGIIL